MATHPVIVSYYSVIIHAYVVIIISSSNIIVIIIICLNPYKPIFETRRTEFIGLSKLTFDFSPVTVKLENVLLTVETNDLKSEVRMIKSLNNEA